MEIHDVPQTLILLFFVHKIFFGHFLARSTIVQAWANYLREKNYSKIFGIHFVIWYPNQVETDQTIFFVFETNTFLKSNNVEYCQILSNIYSFWFVSIQHYSTYHVKLFVSIHFVSICFMIQITSFLIHFDLFKDTDSIDLIRLQIESQKALFAKSY